MPAAIDEKWETEVAEWPRPFELISSNAETFSYMDSSLGFRLGLSRDLSRSEPYSLLLAKWQSRCFNKIFPRLALASIHNHFSPTVADPEARAQIQSDIATLLKTVDTLTRIANNELPRSRALLVGSDQPLASETVEIDHCVGLLKSTAHEIQTRINRVGSGRFVETVPSAALGMLATAGVKLKISQLQMAIEIEAAIGQGSNRNAIRMAIKRALERVPSRYKKLVLNDYSKNFRSELHKGSAL